ncbi:MAG: hypothetical protein AB1643_02870 [Patescibacteria group bacterium]
MHNGFTLVELLIILTLIIVIFSLTIPLGINFYKNQTLDEVATDILSNLRKAHNKAVFQKNDSAFGIKFFPDSYILFQGNNFSSRIQDEDENFSLPYSINVNGISEIVFSKLSGTTTAGALIISSGSNSKTININEQGKVDIQ